MVVQDEVHNYNNNHHRHRHRHNHHNHNCCMMNYHCLMNCQIFHLTKVQPEVNSDTKQINIINNLLISSTNIIKKLSSWRWWRSWPYLNIITWWWRSRISIHIMPVWRWWSWSSIHMMRMGWGRTCIHIWS